MLDLHQISCFVSVYEFGSISRAAESTFLSQQAVSHSLRELEKKLGGPLFERSSNGVVPTQLGKALYDDARKLLLCCDSFEKRAKMMTRGHLGLSLAFADGIFSVQDAPELNRLAAFSQNELGLSLKPLEQTTGECLEMLDSGEADMICVFNPEQRTGLHIQELKTYSLCVGLAPGHPLAGKQALTPEDIAPYAIICDRRDKVLNAAMERLTSPEQGSPQRYAPTTQLSSFADFMRRDNSLLIFTRPFLRTYAGKDAVILPYQCPGGRMRLCAVYRSGHQERGKLARIADWLKRHYDSAGD